MSTTPIHTFRLSTLWQWTCIVFDNNFGMSYIFLIVKNFDLYIDILAVSCTKQGRLRTWEPSVHISFYICWRILEACVLSGGTRHRPLIRHQRDGIKIFNI